MKRGKNQQKQHSIIIERLLKKSYQKKPYTEIVYNYRYNYRTLYRALHIYVSHIDVSRET